MSAPCPHCGGTKTDPVPPGRTLVYFWARHFGFEVRQCGRCRRLRWMNPEEFHKHVAQTASAPLKAAALHDWSTLRASSSHTEATQRMFAGAATAVAEPDAVESFDALVATAVAPAEPPAAAAVVDVPPQVEAESATSQ